MLYLAGKVYVTTYGEGSGWMRPNIKVVNLTDHELPSDLPGMETDDMCVDLDSYLELMGGLGSMLMIHASSNGKVMLFVETEDLHRLAYLHALAANGNADFALQYAADVVLQHTTLTGEAPYFELDGLPVEIEPYPKEIKSDLGYEFLLSHALSVDFNGDDPYVRTLCAKMEALWKRMILRTGQKAVMSTMENLMVLDEYDVCPATLNKDTCVLSKAVESAIDRSKTSTDLTMDQARAFAPLIKAISRREGFSDDVNDLIVDSMVDDLTLRPSELKAILSRDAEMSVSAVFSRNRVLEQTCLPFMGRLLRGDIPFQEIP